MAEIRDLTIAKTWPSQDKKWRFIQTPIEGDPTYSCNSEELFQYFKAGNKVKVIVEPPGEGKKAWKIIAAGDEVTMEDVPPPSKTKSPQREPQTTTRSIMLRYAVDLCIADKIPLEGIKPWAKKATAFVNGEEE